VLAACTAYGASEIPKGQITVTASPAYPGYDPSRMVDGSTENGLYMGSGFSTGYIRFDLGGRYSVTQFEIYNDGTAEIWGYSVYVTDSSVATTSIQASWGAAVATGTFPAGVTGTQTVALTPKEGHYLILYVSSHNHHVHPKEAWIYGDPVIDVSSFAVADAGGSTLYTNSATVSVTAFESSTPSPETIDRWLITEGHSDVPNAGDTRWLEAKPTTYDILTADPGAGIDVTLYGWVKDSADRIGASRSLVINLCLADPVVSDRTTASIALTKVLVTWKTQVATFGFVEYRAAGALDWTATALETARLSSHSHTMTGLTPDTEYEIIIHNNEKAEDAYTFAHLSGYDVWGQDIPRTAWVATASQVGGAGSEADKAIDNKLTTWWWAGQGGITAWLRIDLGSRYDVRVVSFDQNQDLQFVEVYVTDSELSNVAEWGAYVARTTDKAAHQDLITTPKEGRFIILRVNTGWHCAIQEVYAQGIKVLSVASFTIAAQDPPAGTLWTNSDTLDVLSFTADPETGVDGYLITEDLGDVPAMDDDRWLPSAPADYAIAADPGTSGIDVTLTSWVRNTTLGKVVQGPARTIFYTTATPTTIDPVVSTVLGNLAIAMWTTDVPTFSMVRYREEGTTEWTSTAVETAHTTSHSHRLTGLVMDTVYEIEIQNNEVTESAFTYSHVPGADGWLSLDDTKPLWTAVASKELTPAGRAIDGSTATNWWAGSPNEGTTPPQWLRINMGNRYDIRLVSVYQDGGLARCEIYVTDSESPNAGDWGAMVGLTTERIILNRQDVPVTPKEGRYIVLRVWSDWHVAMTEVWAMGLPAMSVSAFDIGAQDPAGSTTITHSATVDVTAFSAIPGGTYEYLITESAGDVPVAEDPRWQTTVPTAYAIEADPGDGIDVTLIGWAKSVGGAIACSAGRTIFYTTTTPQTQLLNVRSHTTKNAFVSWNTDVDSFSFIRYRAVGAEDWAETALETTHRSGHTHEMTNLAPDTAYEIEIHNTQVTDPVVTFDHVPGYSSWVEVEKTAITVTAKSFQDPDAPERAIDGSTVTTWYTGTGNTPQWLRVDFGMPTEPRILALYFTGDEIYDVYVTDSVLDTPADWGTPVASDYHVANTRRDLVLTPRTGRYLIINITNAWHIGANEIWIYTPSPTKVTDFAVADATTGNALWTNEATVSVTAFAGEALGGMAGWMITETDVPPLPEDDTWLPEAPGTYTITGGEGNVALYAWVKSAAGQVGRKSVAILFSTAAPNVTDILVTAGDPGTAVVTWTTDADAFGSVSYSPIGGAAATAAETSTGTSHSVMLTGIAEATNYRIVVISNDKAEAPVFWPQSWPVEGDANLDCRVNILDLIFIRNRLNQDPATGDNWQADVNQDTRINILDLIFVRNRLNTACP